MKKIYFVLPILLILLGCKGVSSPSKVDKSEITDILNAICTKFNNMDIDGVMYEYHSDYRHFGDVLMDARVTWEKRDIDYLTMEINNINIELDGDYAVANFEVDFYTEDGIDSFNEPVDNGDMSYFYRDSGDWYIYGNQKNTTSDCLTVNSQPSGAKIYLNGTSLHQTTPAVLFDLINGVNRLKLYKYGYNEWDTIFVYPQVFSVNKALTFPQYPKPVFNVTEPVQNQHYSRSLIIIAAEIKTQNANGSTVLFEGSEYTLELNGTETALGTNGFIYHDVNIRSGENTIVLRATGTAGNTGFSEEIKVYGDF